VAGIGGFATGRLTTPEALATVVTMLTSGRSGNITGVNTSSTAVEMVVDPAVVPAVAGVVESDAVLVVVVVTRRRGLTWTVVQTRRWCRRWQTCFGLLVCASPMLAVATSPTASAPATTSAARDLT
jgi:hypothetical protein